MQGCTFAGHVQRFLLAYDPTAQHFCPKRPRLSAYGQEMSNRFASWAEITGMQWAVEGTGKVGMGALETQLALWESDPQEPDNAIRRNAVWRRQ